MRYRKLLIFILVFAAVFTARMVFAQNDVFGINDFGNAGVNLGTRSIQETIANLINIALAFLGILATLLLLYGGFVWMTSRGDAQRVDRAKQIIISSLIGLVIILSAYAITRFVLSNLGSATGIINGTNNTNDPPPPGSTGCSQPTNLDEVRICNVSPGSQSVGGAITIYGWHFDAYVAGASRVDILPGDVPAELASCGGNVVWQQISPNYYKIIALVPDVTPGSTYQIKVTASDGVNSDVYPDTPGYTINAPSSGPSIFCVTPEQGPNGTEVTIEGKNFGDTQDTVQMQGPSLPVNFSTFASWEDTRIVGDIPTQAISSNITVTVGVQTSNPDYFRVTCSDNAQCSTGCCYASTQCLPASYCSTSGGSNGPVISSISPDNGAPDNLVTISGSGFGNTAGTVHFTDGAGNQIPGVPPLSINAACTGSYWFDNYIVIGVPAGVATGDVDLTTASSQTSNAVGFTANSTVRPGICALDPTTGVFGTTVGIDGINFSGGTDVLFGGISAYNPNFINSTSAEGDVPNLLPGTVAVQVEVGSETSNPYPFSATATGGNRPTINQVTPDNGPVGQYITINGANFGSTQGQVLFLPGNHQGDFSFPAQCDDYYWTNSSIIVKVPAGSTTGQVMVIRNGDNATSNQKDFSVTVGSPTPGLCAVQPNNGPIGNSVNFYGDNFGNSAGTIEFYNGVSATASTWNSKQALGVTIPSGAQTGQVVVKNSAGIASNGLPFTVGSCTNDASCGTGLLCCPGAVGNYCAASCDFVPNQCVYEWDIFTQEAPFSLRYSYQCEIGIQSPTPWPDGRDGFTSQDIYVDANMAALFTRNVQDADLVNASNFRVYKCNTGGAFNDLACGGSGTELAGNLSILNANSNSEGLMFDPANNLDADTWYKIVIGGATFRAEVGGDIWPTATDTAPVWHFKTRNSSGLCPVDSVSVTPVDPTVSVGAAFDITASPTAPNCNICGGNYTWNWSESEPPGFAFATINPLTNTGNVGRTRFSSTGQTISTVTATESSSGRSDNTQITVTSGTGSNTLQVISYQPTCSGSCGNAVISATFNLPLIPATVVPANFSISGATVTGVTLTGGNRQVIIDHSPLNLNQSYQVTINTNIFSNTVPVDNLDSPVSWAFTTGDTICRIDSVDLIPSTYTSIQPIPEVINYSALTYADNVSCGPQPVICENCSYDWDISDSSVAVFTSSPLDSATETIATAGNGTATISVDVTDQGSPFTDTAALTVNAALAAPQPRVLGTFPANNDSNICTNAAGSVRFDMPMDVNSAKQNIGVYEICGTTWCKIPGSVNSYLAWLYNDSLFRITNIPFEPSSQYLLYIEGDVVSKQGASLDTNNYNFDFNNDGTNDGYGSVFTTRSQYCQISWVEIDPQTDWFICRENNCTDDSNTGRTLNQHQYEVNYYSVDGQELQHCNSESSVEWSLRDDLLNFVRSQGSSVGFPVDQGWWVELEPNTQFGTDYLTVDVDGECLWQALPQFVNIGGGADTAEINIFQCEQPWPTNFASFPWRDTTYNFSTSYCADASGPGGQLPLLANPAMTPPPLATNVLREYIFTVTPPVSSMLEKHNGLGSLAYDDKARGGKLGLWTQLVRAVTGNPALGQSGGVGTPANDIIGIRVMKNDQHLNVRDWFLRNAPNPNASGELIAVDGYEAYRVGKTVYVAATNSSGGSLYTNVYIVAHNIGAKSYTEEIVRQMLNNFRFNINLTRDPKVCSNDSSVSCSTDYDCGSGNTCRAQDLKLRRDTKRLGDLLGLSAAIEDYGAGHKACSNNAFVSCTQNSDCPSGGSCVSQYPLLNSGTFVNGLSTSAWPSWQQTLQPTLGFNIYEDPINRFNGCDPDADPATCWNEDSLEFICNPYSNVYIYQVQSAGGSYELSTTFEYDRTASGPNFGDNLDNSGLGLPAGVDSIPRVEADVDGFCTGTFVPAGTPFSPSCGNGLLDAGEQCDGGFRGNQCDLQLGNQAWWNEQTFGCNPPGTIIGGNLVECQWYTATLTAQQCGGYCGDNIFQQSYEQCEGSNFGGRIYTCPTGSPSCSSCAVSCPGGAAPAVCGDGVWTAGVEECDPSGNPNGVAGVFCSDSGTAFCTASCQIECTSGDPGAFNCGNGILETGEQCDYLGYTAPTPPASNVNNTYTCDNDCTFSGLYCGNNVQEPLYGEICDGTSYSQTPSGSSSVWQYQCSTSCQTTTGGWCGDSTVQVAYEICDGTTPVNQSSPTRQYSCNTCVSTSGGWCGDGIRQASFGELCDGADYVTPTPVLSSPSVQYLCNNLGAGMCTTTTGGYCGDNIIHDGATLIGGGFVPGHGPDFGEVCDDGNTANGDGCDRDCTVSPYAASNCVQMTSPWIRSEIPAAVSSTWYCPQAGTYNLTRDEAASVCGDLGGQLVTVYSATDASQLTAFAGTRDTAQRFWIGLNDRITEGTYVWESLPSSYTNWSNNPAAEPNDSGAYTAAPADCVIMENTVVNVRRFMTENCSTPLISGGNPLQPGFFCQASTATAPNSSCVFVPNGAQAGIDTWVCAEKTDWTTAKNRCETWGGSLATVEYALHNGNIRAVANTVSNSKVWIGYNDRTTEGSFVWDGRSSATGYTNWDTGQPDNFGSPPIGQDCVSLDHGNGRWDDASCTTTGTYGYVCQNVPPSSPPPAVCGNGVIQTGETCDDNNINSGDGCSASCTIESGYTCVGQPSVCTPTSPPGGATPNVNLSDINYLGAFRVNWTGGNRWNFVAFHYNASGIDGYNPGGDPGGGADGYPGSLYSVGHSYFSGGMAYEINIPTPVISPSKNINQLNAATILQGPTGVAGVNPTGSSDLYWGLEFMSPHGAQTTNKLYHFVGTHFEDAERFNIYWSETNLSTPQLAGSWRAGNDSQLHWINTNHYSLTVPTAWADAHVNGKYLGVGRFREGMANTSAGPVLIVIAPWLQGNPPASGTRLNANLLLKYKTFVDVNTCSSEPEKCISQFNWDDDWEGAVWADVNGKQAVMFSGNKGLNGSWYGWRGEVCNLNTNTCVFSGNSCSDDSDCNHQHRVVALGNGGHSCSTVPNDGIPCTECDGSAPSCISISGAYGGGNRGYRADYYVDQILLYDPDDLAAVVQGTKQAWEPQPYARLDITQHMFGYDPTGYRKIKVGGMAIDNQRGLLYVTETYGEDDPDPGDADLPIVHVFRIQ